MQAWWGRKRQEGGHHLPPIQGEWLTIDYQKNNILTSLCLASYLVANWLQKLETKHLFITQKLFLFFCVCVCVVSQFDLSIRKWNYLFVRCESLSHMPNTSLQCSNQPLWKLNLMTGVNTTKQQMGKIKNNKKSNLVELKQSQRWPGKKMFF